MSKYTNGTYTTEGHYDSKSIIVAITLNNDMINDVTVTPNTTVKISLSLQKKFAAAVPDVITGKPIDTIHLDKLAGSSLTTKGFNDALTKIKAQASQ
jgi:uncharacterized protein with FMN-binding domain